MGNWEIIRLFPLITSLVALSAPPSHQLPLTSDPLMKGVPPESRPYNMTPSAHTSTLDPYPGTEGLLGDMCFRTI